MTISLSIGTSIALITLCLILRVEIVYRCMISAVELVHEKNLLDIEAGDYTRWRSRWDYLDSHSPVLQICRLHIWTTRGFYPELFQES